MKTEEQNYLTEWQVLTLQKVIKDNPDKNTLQCLDVVIEKLQKIYEALRCNYSHKSHSLAGKLYAVCQGESACAQALIRPHDRFEDACAELRSTVKVHMDCTPLNAGLFHQTEEHFDNEEVDNGQYFVDRRYGGKLGYVQRGLHARNGRSSFKGGLRGGSDSNNDHRKICFVCKKAGCWSTRHEPSDSQGRINSWRMYMAENDLPADNDTLAMFIVDYEGYEVNQNDDETDLIGMFNAWSEDRTEQFLTSYGTIYGWNTAVLLNNQS
ncbi:BgTH12-04311 [Blumeria graminis f. sp. triticale]|uniref:BgTH12-04311 n=1 Tax=Blumeria graminis f. sp. triticale TaxID=1689686 RepID=A0A9W4GCC3_BLUGR|nr:BgTH12-04311 [Blumeria graminis f. sp. triticale]